MKKNNYTCIKELENKTILVKQVKSNISLLEEVKATLRGLGLRKIGSVSELVCTRSIYGMLRKVSHLVKVEIK